MNLDIDQIIHQPIRTKILALLLNSKECDYTSIKQRLEISDGHMSTHMKLLVNEKYVEVDKAFVDKKPKTTYRISKYGKKRFAEYLENLRLIIEGTL